MGSLCVRAAAWALRTRCAAEVELLLGTTRAELGLPATPAESFLLQDRDSVESVRRACAEACARSRQAISGRALDEVITVTGSGR